MSNGTLCEFSEKDITAALDRLEERRAVDKYRFIMERFPQINVSADVEFQKRYNGFYRVQRRSPEWYAAYYGFMEKNRGNAALTFEKVIRFLHEKTGRVEASFSSKLLHTIRPDMPVWDTQIAGKTGIMVPQFADKKEQVSEAIKRYEQLVKWLDTYKNSPNGKETLRRFDQRFPDSGITDTKKLDLVLWQIRSVLG